MDGWTRDNDTREIDRLHIHGPDTGKPDTKSEFVLFFFFFTIVTADLSTRWSFI